MNRTQNYKRYMDEVKKERKIKIIQFKNTDFFMDRFVGVEKGKDENGEEVTIRLYEKTPNKLVKGKIHCSCSKCTPKTNNKGKSYFGCTKIRYATRNWKTSDKRKILSLNDKLETFLETTQYNVKNLKCLNQ